MLYAHCTIYTNIVNNGNCTLYAKMVNVSTLYSVKYMLIL